MIMILDQLPEEIIETQQIFCCYHNVTNHIQIVKIDNIPHWYLQHITFPGERFLFEAPCHAQLEIYQNTTDGKIACHSIGCDQLQVESA